MSTERREWDLFISYPHAQTAWVDAHLVEPMRVCRTQDGRIPRLFVDRDSIELATNWMERISSGIIGSRKVLLVISREFLASEYCRFEMMKACQQDAVGARTTTIPLLVERDVPLPPAYDHLQGLPTWREDWFDVLVQQLGWRVPGRLHGLRFAAPVGAAIAGETLPEVRVVIEGEDGERGNDEIVTLISEKNTLQGTTSVKSRGGVAVFGDLLFDTAVEGTRLVAAADGCTVAFSDVFRVDPPRAIGVSKQEALIPFHGEPVFLGSSRAVAVVGPESARLYDDAGVARGNLPLPSPVRFRVPVHGGLLVCGWNAEVEWIGDDGSHRRWVLPNQQGMRIPGGIAVSEGDVLLGLWSGRVFRLGSDGSVRVEAEHPGGVQALAVDGELLFVADLDGILAVYRGAERVEQHPLEPFTRALRVIRGAVVGVGERSLSRYTPSTGEFVSLPLPAGIRVVHALAGSDRIVAVGSDGKGILVDDALSPRLFHASPGAVPLSLDARGSRCVLRNADATCSLLHDAKMVLHHPGNLAVSGDGEWLAVEKNDGVRVIAVSSLDAAGGGVG